MKYLLIVLVTWSGLLGFFTMATAAEQEAGSDANVPVLSLSSDPEDPGSMLEVIKERQVQRESLAPASPLKELRDSAGQLWDSIYQKNHLKLGLTFNHLFQWASDVLPDTDDRGMTTDMDFVGSWELKDRGKPTQGKLYFHIEGRWDYGTTGPQTLGFSNVAAAGGTANAFSAYDPTFLLRNFYWEQGSKKAGWAFRAGKITTDSILATSQHISPVTTFLPNAGTGLFVSGYPDSGWGGVGVWYPSDRFRLMALVSDSNGNRNDFGDISEGDLYKALEFGVQIAPRTEKAGYSKFTVWHSDGTKDGQPINASTGAEGYGMTVKLEQELTDDGQTVGVLRWGKSMDGAAIYDEQASVHLLFYDPPGPAGLKNDLIGFAVNWVDSVAAGSREEYNAEVFYRFPLFPGLDTRLSYQYVMDPAFAPAIDHSSVYSLGFRAVF